MEVLPAIEGGEPQRESLLRYGAPDIDDDDIIAVNEVLKSTWLTTGPKVFEFEKLFAANVGVANAIAVSSGTAAIHTALVSLELNKNDEVILPSMTFLATANCIVHCGATPVFADINPSNFLISMVDLRKKISKKTRAIIVVDFAGQPCSYDELQKLSEEFGITLVADACHSLGASYKGRCVGSLADLTAFSFHPVKHITTAEGGMLTTSNMHGAEFARRFRNHGMDLDVACRNEQQTWVYDMRAPGFNYRLSDIQCALGISQLRKLDNFVVKRREIAQHYFDAFENFDLLTPLEELPDRIHSYHLFVIQLNLQNLSVSRSHIFKALLQEGIGVNVHYKPVHQYTFYQDNYTAECDNTDEVYTRILSLPMHPSMLLNDVTDVVQAIKKVLSYYAI